MAFRFNQGDRPLAGYTILRGVGRGGFGEVYYATSDGGKEVALKYLRENPAIELRGVQHCLNLKSPYLVALHDIKQNTDGDFFVIMEYVNGSSLRELMNDAPQGLGPQKAAYLIREIGKGLAYLHDRGIVHRDLKPGNIFYEDGYVKIGDYGLAKMMAASQHSGQTVSVGTVHYMAPEVGSGNYDRTIDIYAMGVILYEMVLGRVPFAGATMGEVLMKHLTAQPAVDELPAPFPDVIRKALAKDPKDRYQNVAEMMADLFSVPSLDQSVAAFEPASLSVAAKRVAKDINATMSASPRPPIAVMGTGSSNIGAPPIIKSHPPIPPLPTGRFGRLHQKINNRAETIATRIDQTALGSQVGEEITGTGRRAEKMIIALLFAAAISIGLAIYYGRNNAVLYSQLVFLNVICMVQATLLGSWLTYERGHVQGIFLSRLVSAGLASLAIMGVGAINSRFVSLQDLAPGAFVIMLVADWGKRYYDGRQGKISLGSAFSVGLGAMILGSFLCRSGLALGAICAAASLTVQALIGMHPLKPGEVVPRTSGEEPDQPLPPVPPGASPMQAAVAVDLADSADRRDRPFFPPIPGASGNREPMKVPPSPSMSSLLPRSRGIRSLWLLTSGLALCSGILFFATTGLDTRMNQGDRNGFILAGIAMMHFFLYTFTRTFRRYRIGLWRGALRPFIFFAGLGTSACAGAAWGLFNFAGDERIGALAGILGGVMLSSFVWFVPIGPYAPLSLHPATDANGKKIRPQGFWFKCAGVGGLMLMGMILSIMGANLDGHELDEAAPAVAIPMSMISIGLIVTGFLKSRRRNDVPVTELSLPMRRVFEVQRRGPDAQDEQAQLFNVMDTQLMLLGYRPIQRSDLMRSYVRGHRFIQLWHKDIRRWNTQLNVAVYDCGDRFRFTCYLDVDTEFKSPGQKKLVVLYDELNDLQQVLAGREVSSNTPIPVGAGVPAARIA